MSEEKTRKRVRKSKAPPGTPPMAAVEVPETPATAVIGAAPTGEYLVDVKARQETRPPVDPEIFGEFLADTTRPYVRKSGEPTHRLLRIYTLDPEVSRLDGAITTACVPYEELKPGPSGNLFTVDLFDEVQGVHYAPADLDNRFVLGQSGRDPSPSDPLFHAQNVYAVASVTAQLFRRALGRHLNWGSRIAAERGGKIVLRPFGTGDRNAYYDKRTGEIRFGYFCADEKVEGRNLPRGYVFTSLSHDVIAHETTHAILDGLRPRFMVPSNPDVYGFHEGFADVVALLQHFSYPDVVTAAIAHSAGAIEGSELLTDIARQFGHTTGSRGALRSVRRTTDVDSVAVYDETADSHQIGSVFASAVFDAFATIYRRRAALTLRIAGVGPNPRIEDLSAELQRELARKASQVAQQFLSIAIRAVDLCPPVDLELGEFLRAVITADFELFPDDPRAYREAWIDAFRRREIYPSNVSSISEDALLWHRPAGKELRIEGLRFGALKFKTVPGAEDEPDEIRRRAHVLWEFVSERLGEFGLSPAGSLPDLHKARVVSLRSSRRVGQNSEIAFDIIAQVLQKRMVDVDGRKLPFYGGSTIVIGPDGEVRYSIVKNLVAERRLPRMQSFARSPRGRQLWDSYLSEKPTFQMLHQQRAH
jgi:hypothetical protein